MNEKYDDFGMKRSSWYVCLYNVAVGKMDISELSDLGVDEDDRKYIEEVKAVAEECKKNGKVMQFSHPFE